MNSLKICAPTTSYLLKVAAIQSLRKQLPADEEELTIMKNIENYSERSETDQAVKFLVEMLKIPNYKLRLECLEYIAEITALQIEIESAVQVYKKSVDEVIDCQGLKEVLLVMLECANAMKSRKTGGGIVQKQNTGSVELGVNA